VPHSFRVVYVAELQMKKSFYTNVELKRR